MTNPSNPTTILFYSVTFGENVLHSHPTGGHQESGIIYNPLNIVNPIVEVRTTDIKQYNMIYIPTNGRYYWIKEYEYIGEANVCKLHCESAVLVNWYSEICNNKAVSVESGEYYNKSLIKNDYPILDQKKFTNDHFTQIPQKDVFILTTLGGGN